MILASEQGGYFTAAQALSVGYSYRQQHFHRQRGNWIQVDRGLFRLWNYPDSEHEDLIRWALWSRDRSGKIQAVVSHETALALHELSDVMPANIHMTIPRSFRKKTPQGLVLHRGVVPEFDIEHRQGFLVTTPARTLRDAAESDLSPEHLNQAVFDALVRGLVTRRTVEGFQLSPLARYRLADALRAVDQRKEGKQ